MALSNVTVEGVERAVAEFDRRRREPFLQHYGFGKARSYFLVRGEDRYDSKAIVGVAHGYDRPDLGPLRPQDFSGGQSTVGRHLESLGFHVEKIARSGRDTQLAATSKALFIMTWNPPNWEISPEEYESRVMATAGGDTVTELWSTGGRKSGIAVGDEVVLLRQGDFRGIIASGDATSEIALIDGRNRVGVAWDTWVHLADRLPVEILCDYAPRFRVPVRASGEKLSAEQAAAVRQHWADWLDQPTELSGDEAGVLLDGNSVIPEGAKARVEVNRYERSMTSAEGVSRASRICVQSVRTEIRGALRRNRQGLHPRPPHHATVTSRRRSRLQAEPR